MELGARHAPALNQRAQRPNCKPRLTRALPLFAQPFCKTTGVGVWHGPVGAVHVAAAL